jgi:hypothetical protein
MPDGFVLPDAERNLSVYHREAYVGRVGFWKRNGRWEVISFNKFMNWTDGLSMEEIDKAMKERKLVGKWGPILLDPCATKYKESLKHYEREGFL